MTQIATRSIVDAHRAQAAPRTHALLTCGAVAGPLFVTVAAAQYLGRDGYDLRRDPLSVLSLGSLGWIQIANFVVAGLLIVAFAAGVRRVLHPGRGGTWGPLLIGGFGVGLIGGGVFVTDSAGTAASHSWHAIAHDVAAGVALDAMIVACFVVARRFAKQGQRGWAVASVVVGVVALAVSWWPHLDSVSVRLAVAVTLLFGWAAALAVRLRAQLDTA
jgi:hypothetical protein